MYLQRVSGKAQDLQISLCLYSCTLYTYVSLEQTRSSTSTIEFSPPTAPAQSLSPYLNQVVNKEPFHLTYTLYNIGRVYIGLWTV